MREAIDQNGDKSTEVASDVLTEVLKDDTQKISTAQKAGDTYDDDDYDQGVVHARDDAVDYGYEKVTHEDSLRLISPLLVSLRILS